MKRLIVFLSMFFLFAPAVCLAGEQDEDQGFSLPIEVTFNSRGTYGFQNVRGFPLSIRSVSRHEGDDWIGSTPYLDEPLPDTVLSLHGDRANDFSIFYTPKIFGIGVMFSFHRQSYTPKDTRYQQNQFGYSYRGTGTSLRWYEIYYSGAAQIGLAGFVTTPWVGIIKQELSCRLKTGGVWDLTGARLKCSSGWDRWSADQHWQDMDLVEFHENRIFVGLEVGLVMNRNPAHKQYLYFQLLFFKPFYDLERYGAAPDLTWEPDKDNYWSFSAGFTL